MKIRAENGNLVLTGADLSVAATLDCGQCFRFRPNDDGAFWRGTALDRPLTLVQRGDRVIFQGVGRAEFTAVWADFFDLSTDYAALRAALSVDPVLKAAADFGAGIRILRQPPWETLCSFILSQNNNIPRIRGIIERLCAGFGEPLPAGGFSFPDPERLAGLERGDLACLRAGFRDKYLLDAARKTAAGTLDLDAVAALPCDEAKRALMTVSGVGPKVADCVLLFGFHRLEAFPVDVWMKRAMANWFPDGLPECAKPFAGYAQQLLFHYARTSGALQKAG